MPVVSEGVEYRDAVTMREGAAQDEFAFCLGDLIAFVRARGWKIRPREVGVQQRREALLTDGTRLKTLDCVHRAHPASLHYNGRAVDVVLIVNGVWITDGNAPEFKEIHAFWRGLHSNCRHGNGRGSDGGHLSFVTGPTEKW